jgi:serine/threonine-protein kinase
LTLDIPHMAGLHPGETLDHYRIENLVARSGMASIFRATDLRNGQPVALKIPHSEMEADVVLFDRFQREQVIGQKLDHPSVMKVLADDHHSQIYMAMEWVEGRLLREILRERGKLPVERAMRLTVRIADTLEYIHSHGVVHRDLKPENIMVNADDDIKLIDFGIAGNEGSRRLTFAKLSQLMGTPDYISPEQVKGKRGDGRSDIYALGVMLYEMLTGKVPFEGPNAFAIMNERLLNNPIPPRELDPAISPELQEVIYRALEREPKNRYAHAREMAWDLEHLDQVGAADRPELKEWKRRRAQWPRRLAYYAMLALIPVVVFGLLIWVAKHT